MPPCNSLPNARKAQVGNFQRNSCMYGTCHRGNCREAPWMTAYLAIEHAFRRDEESGRDPGCLRALRKLSCLCEPLNPLAANCTSSNCVALDAGGRRKTPDLGGSFGCSSVRSQDRLRPQFRSLQLPATLYCRQEVCRQGRTDVGQTPIKNCSARSDKPGHFQKARFFVLVGCFGI